MDQVHNMPSPPLQADISVILSIISVHSNTFGLNYFMHIHFLSFCVCFILREKANLAITISTERNEVLAHAAFVDHPIGELVDQASWEQLLHTHFNTTTFTVGRMMYLI